MASYLVTGVSRGLGFEFLRQLSSGPNNIVVGFVRDKETTLEKIKRELPDRQNILILKGDLDDFQSLKATVEPVTQFTNGKLDYIIANGGLISDWSAFDTLDVLGQDAARLEEDLISCFRTNVIGNVHLFNLYMPLVLRGNAKKVIAITSGYADTTNVAESRVHEAMPYSASKAALNLVIAKYAAQYGKDGVLFLALSPGMVATKTYSEKEMLGIQTLGPKFLRYYPDFKGPITEQESISAMMGVVNKVSIANGDNGAFLSHRGNKEWL